MQIATSALADKDNLAIHGVPELSRVCGGEDLHFLDGVGIHQTQLRRAVEVAARPVGIHAVNDGVIPRPAAAIDTELLMQLRGSEIVEVFSADHARLQDRKLDRIAPVQCEVGDLLRFHGAADLRRLAFHKRNRGLHVDGLGDLAHLERGVHSGPGRGIHFDIALNVFLEARRLDGHFVIAHRQASQGIGTVLAGDGAAVQSAQFVDGGHLRSGHKGIARILHSSRDLALIELAIDPRSEAKNCHRYRIPAQLNKHWAPP